MIWIWERMMVKVAVMAPSPEYYRQTFRLLPFSFNLNSVPLPVKMTLKLHWRNC
jgi:hypothetical protein